MAASQDESGAGHARRRPTDGELAQAERLAEALRANLMKRKAQARARRSGAVRDAASGSADENA